MDTKKVFAALDERMTATIDLGEFHERLEGESVEVWLNPPRSITKELEAIEDDKERGQKFVGILIGLSEEENQILLSKDAPFVNWLAGRVMDVYNGYASGRKKKSPTP